MTFKSSTGTQERNLEINYEYEFCTSPTIKISDAKIMVEPTESQVAPCPPSLAANLNFALKRGVKLVLALQLLVNLCHSDFFRKYSKRKFR